MRKKIIGILFAALIANGAFSMNAEATEMIIQTEAKEAMAAAAAPAAEEIELVDAGYCGQNVLWAVTTDGILLIVGDGSGNGTMYDYSVNKPWMAYEENIFGALVTGDVKYIGRNTFSDLDKLQAVYIEEGVQTIGMSAFDHCDVLKDIQLPNSVTEIGMSAFSYCPKLTTVKLPAKLKKISKYLFTESSGLTSITIPNGVTEIQYSAFSSCRKLKTVKIPGTVTKIDEYAFAGCKSLTSIDIPGSVKNIGGHAFMMCGLQTITIPSEVSIIGNGIFLECKNLTTVNISSGVKKIESGAFTRCVNLAKIRIPASVDEIGAAAFEGCSNLTTVSIMNPGAMIDKDAFANTSSNLLIRCIENSTAHEVALQHNYKYELIDISLVTEYFDDVYPDWYKDYVQYVYDNHLMTGIKGKTLFQPNANITKAQVAQVLYNMEGQPEVTDQSAFADLQDVYAVEWYADAVAWAYSTGIVTGDTNAQKFFPNVDVTREQLALMMYRYADFKEYDVTATSEFEGLVHGENVSNWAADGMKWAVGMGLVSGIEKNDVKDLAPQGNASRAQVAAILQRFCENVK